jgi:hypothetical protein
MCESWKCLASFILPSESGIGQTVFKHVPRLLGIPHLHAEEERQKELYERRSSAWRHLFTLVKKDDR